MFKRFSNTRARAPCNPRRGAVFAPKWAKKFCKPALRQLAKFRVHSRSSVIKNRALVSFSALSRLFALIYPTPSAFYHSSRKLTTGLLFFIAVYFILITCRDFFKVCVDFCRATSTVFDMLRKEIFTKMFVFFPRTTDFVKLSGFLGHNKMPPQPVSSGRRGAVGYASIFHGFIQLSNVG